MNWRKKLDDFKFKYFTMDPSVDPKSKNSRRDWILFMANKTERFPVRQVYDRLIPGVTKMTVNSDFLYLEGEGLIKREKDSDQRSYVIPLFTDSGEAPEPAHVRYKRLFLDLGLPLVSVVLFGILIWAS